MRHQVSRRTAVALGGAAFFAPLQACSPRATVTNHEPTAADLAFADLGARWLKDAAALSPVFATAIGDHSHDAELDDVSATGRAARASLRSHIAKELAGIDRSRLSPDNLVDATMLSDRIEAERLDAETMEVWATDPLIYSDLVGGAIYGLVAREFAPLPERLKSATARLQALPQMLGEIRAALDPRRVAPIRAETYARQTSGATSLIDDLVLSQADQLTGDDRKRLDTAADSAKAALAAHQVWIQKSLAPAASGDFRLGADWFDRKLALVLGSDFSRKEIRVEAKADLEAIREEMYAISRDLQPRTGGQGPFPSQTSVAERDAVIRSALERAYADRPDPSRLFQAAEESLARATEFARSADIITLPDAPVRIIEMPEFQRGVSVAYCDSPGPLDRHLNTFYAISPLPEGWTEEQTNSFLREYNSRSLEELTVHEAMPGHYVQLWHANRHPNTLRAVLGSGTFIEGWACYAQDVMLDAGHGGGDPLRRLINRKWALRVISNALLDQGIHIDGVDEAEAMRLMVQEAFQEEREAAGKWTRARVSSTQLSTYYVGWIEHHQLRKEAEAREGAAFQLKRYHDNVLSHGSPPVRLVRSLLFGESVG